MGHSDPTRWTGLRRGACALAFVVLVLAATVAEASSHRRDSTRARSQAVDGGDPRLGSRAVVIVDAHSNTVLYQRGTDTPRPIASITKLMTALVVRAAGQSLDERLMVTVEDAVAARKSHSRLSIGTWLTRGEYLQLALMASENRAAQVLATNYPGGVEECLRAMAAEAARLGMVRTRFEDPTGLSSGNVSTTSDLARLVTAAARDPIIRRYSTAERLVVNVRGRPTAFHTTDHLVRDPSWQIAVQKTGYIQEAGRCLVLQAHLDGRPVVMVLLDSTGSATRFADARRVRRWLGAAPAFQAVSARSADVDAVTADAAVSASLDSD